MFRKCHQRIHAVFAFTVGHQNRIVGLVVRQGAHERPGLANLLQRHHRQRRLVASKVIALDLLLAIHVVQLVVEERMRWSLSFKLEHHHTRVVARGKQVDCRMAGHKPETVVFTAELLDRRALVQVPHANGLVVSHRQDQVLMRVEHGAEHVSGMATASVHFPGLDIVHAPQLDESVVTGRHNQGQSRVESRPVDALVVALQHILDDGIDVAENVLLGQLLALQLVLKRARGQCRSRVLLAEACDIPHPHGLVQRSRHNQIFRWMELGQHHVVVVAGQAGDLLAVLPVPDADGLVVQARQDPRQVVVERNTSHVVEVAAQGENALARVQRPHFHGVVVRARHEKRLRWMERHASNRTVVVLKPVNQSSHAVVPQLDGRGVQSHKHPGSFRVERHAFGPGRLGLEFGEHLHFWWVWC